MRSFCATVYKLLYRPKYTDSRVPYIRTFKFVIR